MKQLSARALLSLTFAALMGAAMVVGGAMLIGGALLVGGTAAAQSQTAVSAIEIRGNLRVESTAIRRQITTSTGDQLDQHTLGQDIRDIYELGFFRDIVVSAQQRDDGIVVIYEVTEKPAIGRIEFEGNDRLNEDDFAEALGIRTGLILDESAVRATEVRLEDLYREKGYYLVEIESEIIPVSDTEITVRYNIREFDKVQVGAVHFVGNVAIEDSEIQAVLQTRPRDYFSFISKMGVFQREGFAADLQRIRAYYYENGYLDVEVGEPRIELSQDGTQIFITIPIVEHEPYSISGVEVQGDLIEEPEAMLRFTRAEIGERFRSSTVRGDIERITDHFKDLGYAFANVNLLNRVDPETLEISVIYDVTRGEIAHIGRITTRGNTITRDRVIRRELEIEEGDRYNTTKLRNSERYLRRLGFFESVVIREQRSRIDPNLLDIEIEVEERPTRTLQVGAGYSSFERLILNANITENNLFGRGQNLALQVNWSRTQRLFQLSFYEPRLFGSQWQLSTNLFNRRQQFRDFDRDSLGANLSVGYHITRELTMSLGWRAERVRVRAEEGVSVERLRSSNGLSIGPTVGLTWDSRNDRQFPTAGVFAGIRGELSDAIFASDQNFAKGIAFTRLYWTPIWDDLVLKFNVQIGAIVSTRRATERNLERTDDGDFEIETPVSERFFLGGPDSVRGFGRFTLSPEEEFPLNTNPQSSTFPVEVGGHKELYMNLELVFPIVKQLALRGVVFMDAGNAFGLRSPYSLRLDLFSDEDDYDQVLRTSAGFGLRWQSPIGPLRFEWGFPLARAAGERPSVFEFSFGNSF